MRQISVIYHSLYSPQPEDLGTLTHEQLRGSASYCWTFAPSWLKQHSDITISADIHNINGPQYASKKIFSFLQDAMPDRWGRRLIDKRERIMATNEQRPIRHLQDIDYLCLLDDTTRSGALRLQEDNTYLGQYEQMSVPPIANLRQFVDMAQQYERSELYGDKIEDEWLLNLYRQGSSLGGARPKANVRDTDGTLLIAKIPSMQDDYDIALWEHFALCLAKKAGIDVAQTRLVKLPGQRYHTLLSKRFDRLGEQRIHFASAMTLTCLQDGAGADTNNGYLDIVDTIISNIGFAQPTEALCELYRRVAFSILIGNHDDHFRNHGFLLTDKGWQWSPAYDINPSNHYTQSLLISANSNDSSLEDLLKASNDYQIDKDIAKAIINQVVSVVRSWRTIATSCGISKQEQQRFAARLDNPHLLI